MNEAGRKGPWTVVGITCGGLLVLGCLCVGAALTAGGTAASLLQRAIERFRGRPAAELDLYESLARKLDGSFQVGPGCVFTQAGGTALDSQLDPSQPGSYSRDLDRQEVIDAVTEFLQAETFLVRGGEASLQSGSPVTTSLLSGRQVWLRVVQQAGTPGPTNRSLEGKVSGDVFSGSYRYSQDISDVAGGQGIEKSVSLYAELTCPLNWKENPD